MLFSEQFGDVYFSLEGGLEEARHVFLAGNGLPHRFGKGRFTIAELGFGTGLNFLITWQEWRKHAADSARLDYVSIEKHPLRLEDLARVQESWPQLQGISRELRQEYPPLIAGFHRLHLDGGRVSLTLLFGEVEELLPELDAAVDAFYLDGFAPSRNPRMWTRQVFDELHRLAAPGATAATFSVAGSVRTALSEAGFNVERRPGFGRKREMLVAQVRKPHQTQARSNSAVVVGAGIAGTSCAFALARRGISVHLLEANRGAGQGASGNPAALVRPFPGLDVGPRSRFTWSAFAYAARHYRALAGEREAWRKTGVLQLARDAAHAEKQARAMERVPVPASLCRAVTAKEGTELCGGKVTASGLWLEDGGWVAGAGIVTAAIEAAVGALVVRTAAAVHAIEPCEHGFVIRTGGGSVFESPCVILANGHAASGLLPQDPLVLRTVRGQASLLTAQASKLRTPVCQEGYVIPVMGATHVAGATYDEESDEPGPRERDDRTNLARARRMLPHAFDVAEVAGSWVGLRCVSADRRPVVGQLRPGLYACLALGSRGFTWAPLAGELTASMIGGEPLPLERSVARAISPERFTKYKR